MFTVYWDYHGFIWITVYCLMIFTWFYHAFYIFRKGFICHKNVWVPAKSMDLPAAKNHGTCPKLQPFMASLGNMIMVTMRFLTSTYTLW